MSRSRPDSRPSSATVNGDRVVLVGAKLLQLIATAMSRKGVTWMDGEERGAPQRRLTDAAMHCSSVTRRLWRHFDTDDDGYLTVHEAQKALENLGLYMSQQELEAFVLEYGEDVRGSRAVSWKGVVEWERTRAVGNDAVRRVAQLLRPPSSAMLFDKSLSSTGAEDEEVSGRCTVRESPVQKIDIDVDTDVASDVVDAEVSLRRLLHAVERKAPCA